VVLSKEMTWTQTAGARADEVLWIELILTEEAGVHAGEVL
jgi:hypothetical protein